MRKPCVWIFMVALLLTCVSCSSNKSTDIIDDVAFLCSKECFGWLPGSDGNSKAQDYIAAQFEAVGLQPMVGCSSFSQPYTQLVFDAQDKSQVLTATYPSGSSKTFYSGVDFYPYLYLNGTFSGNIVSSSDDSNRFVVQCDEGALAGEEITFVKSDMATVRLVSEGTPLPFRCNSTLYLEIKDANSISLWGELQWREDTVHNIVGVLPGKIAAVRSS